MLRSMTGFGKGSAAAADGSVCTLELNSVNRKQLEIRLSMPAELSGWEPEARKRISAAVSRGSLQLRVNLTRGGGGVGDLDRERLEALFEICLELRKKYHLSPEADPAPLLTLPGVLGGSTGSCDPELLAPALNAALEQALAAYGRMRETEGQALHDELAGRLAGLRKLLGEIEPFAAGLAGAARERLLAKLTAEHLPVDLNDERFLRELLFYADKADVTEEITRLKSHFGQFEQFLEAESEPAGRSMDFLIQEMFREITTLGNKAGTSPVSRLVVTFKSELEKMREQVQNVE